MTVKFSLFSLNSNNKKKKTIANVFNRALLARDKAMATWGFQVTNNLEIDNYFTSVIILYTRSLSSGFPPDPHKPN